MACFCTLCFKCTIGSTLFGDNCCVSAFIVPLSTYYSVYRNQKKIQVSCIFIVVVVSWFIKIVTNKNITRLTNKKIATEVNYY